MENLRGAHAPTSRIKVSVKVKTFVLDTNVLLHDPQSIFKFEENNLAIPVEVLEYVPPKRVVLRASIPHIEQLLKEEPGLRVVYRELPILGPDSVTAARKSPRFRRATFSPSTAASSPGSSRAG